MSIWKVSPTEGTADSEPFVRNAIEWDQLLNNLDLQTSSSDSSEDDNEEAPQSHISVFSEGRHSYRGGMLMPRSTSAGSKECAKPSKSLNATRGEDDGYSSEDEHDSPANQESSDSASAGFGLSSGLTATTAKIGSATSGNSEPASPNEPAKTYFYINGVRHCVQDEQNGVKWKGMVAGPQTTPKMTATPVKRPLAAPPVWRAAQQLPASNVAPMAKTVIASNESGAPVAWECGSKAAVQTSMPTQSPPRYDAGHALPSSYPAAPSLNFTAMAAPPAMPSNVAYYPSCNGIPMGAPPAMPAPYTPSRAPMPSMNAAPVYGGGAAPVAHNAALATNSILGYVYVDSNGCLRVASNGDSPLPPASTCPPPTQPLQPPQPPQLAHQPSDAAAVYQCASSVPRTNPMQYGAAYAADGSMCPPTVPSMPVSKSPSAAWGTTKAWVFRDGRWISLSM